MNYHLTIPEPVSGIQITCETEKRADGITHIRLHLESREEQVFPPMTCKLMVPALGVRYLWNPKIHMMKALNLDWFLGLKKTNGFTGAPIQCLIGRENQNYASLGLSDTLNTCVFWTLPVEETGEYAFQLELFSGEPVKRSSYDITLRLDMRNIPYYEALRDMADWWGGEDCNRPVYVPPAAMESMYSTWYSFHQKVETGELLKQCRLSKDYGCRTILLDDGWQTEDSGRGYAWCGDWQPAPSKIPDMRGFVDQVHSLGMKVVTWYSVPFIGEKSQNFRQFQDMLIDPEDRRGWHVLDPRYPMVREFIVSLYEKALRDWDFDGFKLDFVDEFVVTTFSGLPEDSRRDFVSRAEAADCLMKECVRRLKAVKPDILLEFRQTYNGPRMRSYGNIFRAVDCPLGDLDNRVRVTDIRLLAGNSAVHSDMLMWHEQDSPESAAMQIIGVLFSVPQISMRLDCLSRAHQAMLRFYSGLWKRYKNPFVHGSFHPENPSGRYTVIWGAFGDQMACAYYSREVLAINRCWAEMVFVNGSGGTGLAISWNGSGTAYETTVFDCMGNQTFSGRVVLDGGLAEVTVPISGVTIMKRTVI